ncbi:cytochrome bc1 complex diheme cytochrome c subunit [Microtetraspora niveoalba]|uniref:cytochrome bc1 complex diheme cytochrome c subunit n=1 Tax=Microtetraspora niveoalba TaxID=46175 RepID=UPI00082AD278|nr:c-type cytochrome [Microtetraspora niveoalba]
MPPPTQRRTTARRLAARRILAAAPLLAVPLLAVPLLTVPPAAPPAGPSAPAASAAPSPAPISRGRELYGISCASCHGQRGEGTQYGPSLKGVGAASADFQLSTGRMPLPNPRALPRRREPAFSRRDIDALVSYVASFGPGPAVPAVGRGNVRQGLAIYLRDCAACHSSTGEGGALPAGRYAPSLTASDPVQIAEAVRLGPGPMPKFGRGTLSDDALNSVIAYIRSIPRTSGAGGWPLGGVGPVTEGAIAWVLGLGLLVLVIRALGKRAR